MNLQENDIEIEATKKENLIHIKLIPPKSQKAVATDIICLLDVSGSMSSEATVKNSEGIKESQGYSLLDILQHSVKTTIYNLSSDDRFGLVTFSTAGKVVFELDYMTNEAKELANKKLQQIKADGVTNLWDGLRLSLDQLRTNQKGGRQQTIILLTDGEPNRHPQQGTLQAFMDYQKSYPEFMFSLHTLALGKAMDSKILASLAELGRGQFSFIPCSGFMGTIFVNTFSNIMCTVASNAQLQVSQDNLAIDHIYGYKMIEQNGKLILPVGDIKFEQSQDFILSTKNNPNNIKINLQYYNILQAKTISIEKELELNTSLDTMLPYHYCRLLLISNVNEALNLMFSNLSKLPQAQEIVKNTSELIQKECKQQEQELDEIDLDLQDSHPLKSSLERLQNLYLDISGEIRLSFLKIEWFNQWGQHYLPSLLGCHSKQTCNNFKDPGIKNYGGELFKTIKQQTEDTFMKLPPPTPSLQNQSSQYQKKQHQQQQQKQQQQQQKQAQVQQPEPQSQPSFADYYDAGGGCFSGNSQLLLCNGDIKMIKNLKKNDIVQTRNGLSKVLAVIKIKCMKPLRMVTINNQLQLSPKHPILINNQWIKPSSQFTTSIETIDYLYNLVLEKGHQVLVGGVWCVTLGHGIKEQNAFHPYFGSSKVIEELNTLQGFGEGLIQLKIEQFSRNCNGQVISIKELKN